MSKTPLLSWLTSVALVPLPAGLGFAGAAAAADMPTATTTTLYKSTGADGRTVYGDRPAPQARDATTLTFVSPPASPLSAQTLAYIEQMKKSAGARASAPPPRDTVLFSAVWCGYCRQAKAYLAAKHVPYREIDIETPDGAVAFAQSGGSKGIPLLLSNGQRVSGFSAPAYDALLLARK